MKKPSMIRATFLAFVCLAPAMAHAQQGASKTPSLGDLARQLRAEREHMMTKPKKVYTNDNLPPRTASEGLTVASGMSTGSVVEPPEAATATKTSSAHGESFYRGKAKEIRSRLELHQRQLTVLQQKLAQNQMQFYPDPQKALMQEYSRSDINKLTDEVNKKKQEIEADQKALEDLQDQLRREGGNFSWLL